MFAAIGIAGALAKSTPGRIVAQSICIVPVPVLVEPEPSPMIGIDAPDDCAGPAYQTGVVDLVRYLPGLLQIW